MYDLEYLERLITNKTEEDTYLDYKAAGALHKPRGDELYRDISKDVSSFANSDGGVLIYGISEDAIHKHLPGYIDPINRNKASREWLEQIIQNKISPRLSVSIHPIEIGGDPNQVVYVIVVPKGSTAHQSSDKKYYKRANSHSQVMEDYEIKDVINRVKHPKIVLEFEVHRWVNEDTGGYLYHLKVFAKNVSPVLASYVNCYITIPQQCLASEAQRIYPVTTTAQFFGENTIKEAFQTLGSTKYSPLLPQRRMELNVCIPPLDQHYSDYPHAIEWQIFADNAEQNTELLSFDEVPLFT